MHRSNQVYETECESWIDTLLFGILSLAAPRMIALYISATHGPFDASLALTSASYLIVIGAFVIAMTYLIPANRLTIFRSHHVTSSVPLNGSYLLILTTSICIAIASIESVHPKLLLVHWPTMAHILNILSILVTALIVGTNVPLVSILMDKA